MSVLANHPTAEIPGLPTTLAIEERPAAAERRACYHCGDVCRDLTLSQAEKVFCCQGCLLVHELLTENGLSQFYDLGPHPGVRIKPTQTPGKWACLDEPALQQRMLDFSDGKTNRVTFHIPSIHCVACVWLLENLFRLREGIGSSQVNFSRREVSINYTIEKVRLSDLVELLEGIGYTPRLTLGELERRVEDRSRRKRWLQVGIAGFAFGNIMLMSVPAYLGLDTLSGPTFKQLFGFLSLLLALPVVLFSASDYWRSALLSFRQRVLTLDVPIALGLAALYAQSAFEIVSGHGEGYLDSLSGLVFFLLCGRVFQQLTHDRIVFDRDYKSFFPLSVIRRTPAGEESVAISNLAVGDRLVLRNKELIPADTKLLSPSACVDYSFVTGESDPVTKHQGDYLYAGGQQLGAAIEVETIKPVSQSYLTNLWSHEAFQKQRRHDLDSLTNRYSRRFTRLVIAIAFGATLFWWASGDPARGVKAFASVLIVACPCALALAAPFTLGTAQRLLARGQIFLKNGLVIERMAQVDNIVFDKTGTLTALQPGRVTFQPNADCGPETAALAFSVCRLSTHPASIRIAESFPPEIKALPVQLFTEVPGSGVIGIIGAQTVRLGSRKWLESEGIATPDLSAHTGTESCLAIGNRFAGTFVLHNDLRPNTDHLLRELGSHHELTLLSGDNERERQRFEPLFGPGARLCFNQSPLNKLEFVENLQKTGKTVMMVGDGLNDAGALKQSDVGAAVVEQAGAFSPGSDVILAASRVPALSKLLAFSRQATRIVRLSFGISAVYNAIGISVAAAGILSPLICAILMPLSSVSVVLFASSAAHWAAKRTGVI